MRDKNFNLIDNYIMENLHPKLSIQQICNDCYISRASAREYYIECGYPSYEAMIKDYYMQQCINNLTGRDKIAAVQEYLFQFLNEEQMAEFTNDNRIVFLYVKEEYQRYYNLIYSNLLTCKHKINPINSLDLTQDALYQPKNKHQCVCTIIGEVDPEDLDPTQLYRIMHFANAPKYNDYMNIQEVVLKKFHPKYDNYHMLGVIYVLELYS